MGARLYVTNPPAGAVQIVDGARPRPRVTATLTGLGRPRTVAFGLGGRVALVTDEGRVTASGVYTGAAWT